jgi:hypothetical protein
MRYRHGSPVSIATHVCIVRTTRVFQNTAKGGSEQRQVPQHRTRILHHDIDRHWNASIPMYFACVVLGPSRVACTVRWGRNAKSIRRLLDTVQN